MLGPAKLRRLDVPIAVSLEDLVPQDHFYRHLEATLDLSFVRDWTRELYGERGRPSIDPVVFFKLQLIMFFEGIRSERQLIETASAEVSIACLLHDHPQLIPDAGAEYTVPLFVVAVPGVGPAVARVEPDRPAEPFGRLPAVPWKEVGVQVGVGVAQDFVVQPVQPIGPAGALDGFPQQTHVQ
jgi:hypothetical protein